ncbi:MULTISPECIES: LysR substrate-binding domain-containing protein [unclassified Nocardiopsis]|jgi:DNA-binding transcriptional LysR family regulator|uniref:LysR substrate-binding domain-containing protein n=1 Tax=unclassified Nocardiopsis TaxID=2649073 RepID=UPI00066A69A4|nr:MULTISPECIES: LysR substrate-binding domain-containing protein [unclassified Nocardiopsis]MBQ1082798.1 LysR family transcriptional regulator [Nocardiopsis sp. B62]
MADVSLRQLEYLTAVARHGSVTAAARELFVSQSAVSTALVELESALGITLFVRSQKGMRLTTSGQRAIAAADNVLASLDQFRESARQEREQIEGTLTIGCYATIAPILLPRVIAEFSRRHPQVQLSFVEAAHERLLEDLLNTRIDLAITYDYKLASVRTASGVTALPLRSEPPYVLAPVGGAVSAKERPSLADLAVEPLILFDLPPGGEYFLGLFTRAGLTPNVRFRTTSFEMVRALVARGLGNALLTQRTVLERSYEDLPYATRELDVEPEGLGIEIVQLTDRAPVRRTQAFIEVCREVVV